MNALETYYAWIKLEVGQSVQSSFLSRLNEKKEKKSFQIASMLFSKGYSTELDRNCNYHIKLNDNYIGSICTYDSNRVQFDMLQIFCPDILDILIHLEFATIQKEQLDKNENMKCFKMAEMSCHYQNQITPYEMAKSLFDKGYRIKGDDYANYHIELNEDYVGLICTHENNSVQFNMFKIFCPDILDIIIRVEYLTMNENKSILYNDESWK